MRRANIDALWELRTHVRNDSDSELAFDFAITLLFLKAISDRPGAADGAAFPSPTAGALDPREPSDLVVPYGSAFGYLYQKRADSNLLSLVEIALRSVEEANKVILGGVFSQFALPGRSSRIAAEDRAVDLRAIVEIVDRIDLFGQGHRDEVDVEFGDLVDYLAVNRSGQTALSTTPAEVAALLIELLQLQPGASVYDPACGTGSILVEAARKIHGDNIAIFGEEVNPRAHAIAHMKMVIDRVSRARILIGDSLRQPSFINRERLHCFDYVASNPPFVGQAWDSGAAKIDVFSRFRRGVPPKNGVSWAFISHIIASVKPTGRAAVIVPPGVLFRGGIEAQIRQAVINENILDAVIGMPANMMPRSHIAFVILLFDKTRVEKRRNNVLFIDASRDFVRMRSANRLSRDHSSRIVRAYAAFCRDSIDGAEFSAAYARSVPWRELMENSFSLHFRTYLALERKAGGTRPRADEVAALEAELISIRSQRLQCFEQLGLPGPSRTEESKRLSEAPSQTRRKD
jgi:type I restriction enzyme M protein